MNSRTAALFLVSCFAVSALQLSVTTAQDNTEPVVLELGKPVERELAGGQSHRYTLTVPSNQYLRLLARQHGVDIMLDVLDSTGRKLVDEYDNTGSGSGIETFALITSEAGNCTVEVRTVQKTAPRVATQSC